MVGKGGERVLKIYYTDVSELPDQTDGLTLSAYRKDKLASCRNARMRKQQLGAELLLLWALRQEGIRDLPPTITVLQGGKPVLQDLPLQFSLSHSGSLAACAVSDRPVGLDLERSGRFHESLLRRCFSPEEQKRILESDDPDSAFTELWTGKESILKHSGTGIRGSLALAQPLSPGPGLRIWHTRISACTGNEMDQAAAVTEYQLSACFETAAAKPEGLSFVASATLVDTFSVRRENNR